MTTAVVRPLLWGLLALSAVGTLAVANRDVGVAFSAGHGFGTAALLMAGAACAAAGLGAWQRRSSSSSGLLLAAAGMCWFLTQWDSPAAASSLGFTVGMVGAALPAALVGHAVFLFPAQRLTGAVRAAVCALYVAAGLLLGLLPTLTYDPVASGCSDCPRNLLLLVHAPHVGQQGMRAGEVIAVAAGALLCVLAVLRLLRMTPALRRVAALPVSFATLFLAAAAGGSAHLLMPGASTYDAVERVCWFAQCAALVGLAVSVIAGWSQAGRTRRRVARLVVDISQRPPPGGLRDLLARSLGDDSIAVVYVLSDGSHVDVTGARVAPLYGACTAIVSGGTQLAVLRHRPGLLDDPSTVEEVARAASLVLHNEWLQAELGAQLHRLRDSRRRIVTAADAARRRLERDVHDGAQQQLVTLLLAVRMSRTRATGTGWAACAAAEQELLAAVEELRSIAHGIFPAVLADEGLAEAVDAFAEGAGVPVQVVHVPSQRLSEPVEGAAYFAVTEAVQRSAATRASVSVSVLQQPDRLEVDLDLVDGKPSPGWLQSLEDRVGALDGSLACSSCDGRLRLHVEIPCES